MSDQPKPKKSCLGRLLKFFAIFTVLMLIVFTVLGNIGGNGDAYKNAVEEFLAEASGQDVSVQTLNEMRFFPVLKFDFEGVEFKDRESLAVVGELKKANISAGFWDVVLQNGKFRALEVEGFYAQAGVFAPHAISVERFAIDDQEDGTAKLVGNGYMGKYPVRGQVDLDVSGTAPKKTYDFAAERPFELHLGGLSATGTVKDAASGIKLQGTKLSFENKNVLEGDIYLAGDVSGDLKIVEHGTVISPDIKIEQEKEQVKISGDIDSEAFYMSDFTGESRLRRAINYARNVVSSDEKSEGIGLSGIALDIDLDIKQLFIGETEMGEIRLPIAIKDSVLEIKPKGKISGGDLDGEIVLNDSASPATLKATLDIDDMNYGRLQKDISGSGKVKLRLTANGKTTDDIEKNLNGSFTFTGGKGEFGSGLANLWGRGLVNTILPDFSNKEALGVNCAIMDFTIENALATSNALFVDGTHVTIAGEGSYDIAKDYLDISLKPKQKEISIGDLSSAVKIQGEIASPSISPSLLGLGQKVGTLLLGTVNPAFFALSLADLGLNDNHPCRSYLNAVKEGPTAAEPVKEEKPQEFDSEAIPEPNE